MIIENIKLVDIVNDYKLVIDENIQRSFEWKDDKYSLFFNKLKECSDMIVINKEYRSVLGNRGKLTCFKQTQNTNVEFFLDDGGHRMVSGILVIFCAKEIIETYALYNDDNYSYAYSIMKNFINNVKKYFFPHKKCKKEFDMILNGQCNVSECKKSKQSSLLKAYYFFNKKLNDIFNENENDFINICGFLVNDFKFFMEKNEWTPIDIRLIVYNQINGVSQPQTEFKMGMSTLSEDAESLGVENFSQMIATHQEVFKDRSKYGKKQRNNDYYLFEDFIFINLFSEYGFLTKDHDNVTIYKLIKKFIYTVPVEQRIAFYENLFDETKVQLFLNLYDRTIKLELPPSKESYICDFLIQSNIFYVDDKGPTRRYVYSIFFNVMYNVFEIRGGNKIIGTKEGFNSSLAWNVIRNLHLYRFLFTTDDKTGLGELLSDSKKILNNEMLRKFSDLSDGLISSLFSNENYINDIFYKTVKDNYRRRDTRLLLHMVANISDNINESIHSTSVQLRLKDNYHIDHIIPRASINSDLKHNLGNLRILSGPDNMKDNHTIPTRYIEPNAQSFPIEMTGRNFTVDDVIERRKWICTVIKTYNSYIHDFQFKS